MYVNMKWKMVDTPRRRKCFLENWHVQWPTTHVLQWIVIFLYGLVYVCRYEMGSVEDQEDQRS